MNAPKKQSKNNQLIRLLNIRQVDEKQRNVDDIMKLVKRRYYLHDIIPSEQIMSHIFLGFTQNGQHLLSYCFESHSMQFCIWNFNYKDPLKLIAKHCVYSGSCLADNLIENTGISVYQWPSDDRHLLILTTPEYPLPSVINITLIYFDQSQSYILKPETLTYGVIGWGYRRYFLDKLTNCSFEDYLTPGLLLFKNSACAFTTGSEVVCIQIKRHPSDENIANTNVLDIEKVLVERVDSKRLITYEIVVFGMKLSPTTVFVFVHAVLRDSWTTKSYKEFVVHWHVDKGSYEIDKSSTQRQSISFFHQLNEFQKFNNVYFIDNSQFMECQSSLDVIKSPVDNVYISLSI